MIKIKNILEERNTVDISSNYEALSLILIILYF